MRSRLKFILLFAITAFAAGCDKDESSNPTTTGTVKGSISPAAGASKVYLITGTDTISGTPTASGTYEITQVKAGTYQVTVKPNDGYAAPAPISATVTIGQTTEIPVITLTQLPTGGLMSVSMNGAVYSASPMFSAFNNGRLSIYTGGFQIHLTLPVITGNGTFTQANSDLEVMVLAQTSGAGWESSLAGGSATLTVTSYNATTKKGNATFSFVAPANGMGSTGTKTGTNGTLQNVRLKN